MIIENWLDHLTVAESNALCEVLDFIQNDCSISEQKYIRNALGKLFNLCKRRVKYRKGDL